MAAADHPDLLYHAFLPPPTLTPFSRLASRSSSGTSGMANNDYVTFHSLTNEPPSKLTQPSPLPAPPRSAHHIDPDLLPAVIVKPESSPPPPAQRPTTRARPPSLSRAVPESLDSSSSDRRRSKRLRPSTSHLGITTTEIDQSESFLSSLADSISDPTASFANLPRWSIPLSELKTLESLLGTPSTAGPSKTRRGVAVARRGRQSQDWNKRVTLLCCVMEAEAPVRRKDVWVASWRVSAPRSGSDSLTDPVTCEVKLWRSCARDYGGMVRKGDVILLENVEFRPGSEKDGPHLVISPAQGWAPPRPTITYRTLPRYLAVQSDYIYRAGPRRAVGNQAAERGQINSEDRALRPDLSLARSDPGIRRVADLARWCAEWVGGEAP